MTGPDAPALALAANVSLLFAELPYLERFGAAAAAGFQATESWWPYPTATPDADDVQELVDAVHESGIPLVGLNLFAGDQPGGERGILSHPDRRGEFAANLEVVARIASATGCRVSNALYGQRRPGLNADVQSSTAIANLALAARRLGEAGVTVVLEPLTLAVSGDYPILTADDAFAVVDLARAASGLDNIGLLLDTFHLANNGEDLLGVIDRHADRIAHVQLADTPGRGEPGTGVLPIPDVIYRLWASGYRGLVAAEYQPVGRTLDGLSWVDGIPALRLRVG
ncbi:TIM barrel protein [soil metagenome]